MDVNIVNGPMVRSKSAVPTKSKVVAVRLLPDVYVALSEAAEADDRSISQYVDRIIKEHLKSKPSDTPRTDRPAPKSGRRG